MHILEQIKPGRTFTSFEVLESQLSNIIGNLSFIKEGLSDEKKESIDSIRTEVCMIRNVIDEYIKKEKEKVNEL